MTEFRPGTSPPPVRMPILPAASMRTCSAAHRKGFSRFCAKSNHGGLSTSDSRRADYSFAEVDIYSRDFQEFAWILSEGEKGMKKWSRGTGCAACLAVACVVGGAARTSARPPNAEPVDPKFFQEMHWRMIGPFRGGRVLGVTGVRGEPEVYYFGSVGGGVWKTNDAGRTWNPIFDSQPVASIGAIAVAPSNREVIYVGSGEADMRSSISGGNGMYKSTDGGKTWARAGLSDSRQIGRILVDPRDANRVFVAALGHAYGPNAERGVYRSSDGGTSWQRVLFKDENTGAIDLAFEPGNAQTIWAVLWQTRRPPWSIYAPSNGPGSG